jgi:uncharacterized alkaline shock family protein YloU
MLVTQSVSSSEEGVFMSPIAPDYEKTDFGHIQIAPEVIEIIAGFATIDIEGVAGMSGGLVGGIAELLGRKNLSKGVKVQVGERQAALDVSIIVEYGIRIPELAHAVQQNVKHSIHSMTGLDVVEVNVHIHDVHFKEAEKPIEGNSSIQQRIK